MTLSRRQPRIGATGLSRLGSTGFSITLRDASPNLPAFLMLGASNTVGYGLPLPIDLAILGAAGCKLLVSGEVALVAIVNASGVASVSLPIPNSPALASLPLYAQWANSDSVTRLGLVVSDGAIVRIR